MGELLLDKEVNATFSRRAELPGFGETEVMSIRVLMPVQPSVLLPAVCLSVSVLSSQTSFSRGMPDTWLKSILPPLLIFHD